MARNPSGIAVADTPSTSTPVPFATNHAKAPTRTASLNEPVSPANQTPTATATLTTIPTSAAARPAIGADIAITRPPDRGTQVKLSIPVEEPLP